MARTIFLQHYRVCLGSDGTPNELGRDGGAIAYEPWMKDPVNRLP